MILIVSSLVVASAVGGSAQAARLERAGMATMLMPTVLFGRHPGLGAPGGGATPQDIFEGMLAGFTASGALDQVQALITGYFANPAQITAAARLIDDLRQANPGARVIVDPIMGDAETGLYVPSEVADALTRELVPQADLVCPNAWELDRLSDQAVTDAASALSAARALGRPVLASSVADGLDLGVLLATENGAYLATHARAPGAPRGTGDILTAAFAVAWLTGMAQAEALAAATQTVADEVLGIGADVRVRGLV